MNCTNFTVYKKDYQIKFEPKFNPLHKDVKAIIFEIAGNNDGLRNLSLKDYISKKDMIDKNDMQKLFLFNHIFMEHSLEMSVVMYISKTEKSINPLYYRNYLMKSLLIGNEGLDKAKFLIDFGQKVNDRNYDGEGSILHRALNRNFSDLHIELILKSGGVVYHKISKRDQDRVNRIMQPYIDKIKMLMTAMFKKDANSSCLPIELKNIICRKVIQSLKLAPEVFQKILKLY